MHEPGRGRATGRHHARGACRKTRISRTSSDPSPASTFGLVVFSKQLDALAWAATVVRLGEEEAPRREIERQKKQEEDSRAAREREKARLVSKATFPP